MGRRRKKFSPMNLVPDTAYPRVSRAASFKTRGTQDVSPLGSSHSQNLDHSSSKKIAPRSGLQFQVGPLFENTEFLENIYTADTLDPVCPQITARIDRGLKLIDNQWIGYKRNYFTVTAAFEMKPLGIAECRKKKFRMENGSGDLMPIEYFAMQLVSVCVETNEEVPLVQHTAKRDKGPQSEPPIYPIIPGRLPDHTTVKEAANIRNDIKIAELNSIFYLLPEERKDHKLCNTYPYDQEVSTAARYERIQFSTSIHSRKFSHSHHHFYLALRLLGVTGGRSTVLSSAQTPPLIVRGRSPSNYTKEGSPQSTSELNSRQQKDSRRYQELKPFTEKIMFQRELNYSDDGERMNSKFSSSFLPIKPQNINQVSNIKKHSRRENHKATSFMIDQDLLIKQEFAPIDQEIYNESKTSNLQLLPCLTSNCAQDYGLFEEAANDAHSGSYYNSMLRDANMEYSFEAFYEDVEEEIDFE